MAGVSPCRSALRGLRYRPPDRDVAEAAWVPSSAKEDCAMPGSRMDRAAKDGDAHGWAGEKLVLHKLRFHPGFAAPFSPPCEGGLRGGGPGTTSHKVFPHSLPLSPFASLSRGEKNRFRFPRLPHHPPYPPFARGGFNGAPFARGGKGSLARDVVPSRATKTRVSKPSLQLGQHQLLTGPSQGSRSIGRSPGRQSSPEPCTMSPSSMSKPAGDAGSVPAEFAARVLGESIYDRVTSFLMAVVLGAMMIVGLMGAIYITNQAY